jgi:hypothetical protein
MPNHQVIRFQKMAPDKPHRMTVTERTAPMSSKLTNLPMVLATAVPPRIGPRNSKVATMTTAWTGVRAREAMGVAIMLEASWKPLV